MIAEKTEVVEALFQQIEQWIQNENKTEPEKKKWEVIRTSPLTGTASSETLTITTPGGSVTIELAGIQYDRRIVVDIYAWPTLIRMRLLNRPESKDWEMETDAGVPFYHEWNQANFLRLLRDITTTR